MKALAWKVLGCLFLTAMVWGQIIETPAPVIQIEIDEPQPTNTLLTLLHPVDGRVVTDSILHIEGAAPSLRPGAFVRLRLGDFEQLAPVGAQGHFATTVSLWRVGDHRLTVDAGDTSRTVTFTFRLPLTKLELAPLSRSLLPPGETLALEALATFQNGRVQPVTEAAAWQVSDPTVGRIDAPGRFTALREGPVLVSATYQDARVEVPIQVKVPVAPPPSAGLNNITVDHPDVVLKVLDHADEDGDVLSIFHNDEPVVEFLEIFHQPRTFSLTLIPGLNRIEIRALNEGREPPNTATLVVVTHDGVFEQKFKAEQHTSGQFFITLR